MNETKLVVRAIVGEEKNGMSRVIVSRDVLGDIIQTNQSVYQKTTPKLSYVNKLDAHGNDIRVFSVGGVELFSFYDRAGTGKSYFFMKTEEAKKHLLTLAEERATQPKMAFDVSEFDLSIVSSAPATA